MTRLRIVKEGDTGPPSKIGDEIRALAERAIADGAVTFFARWETATTYNLGAVPDAPCVIAGHSFAAKQWLEEAFGFQEGDDT